MNLRSTLFTIALLLSSICPANVIGQEEDGQAMRELMESKQGQLSGIYGDGENRRLRLFYAKRHLEILEASLDRPEGNKSPFNFAIMKAQNEFLAGFQRYVQATAHESFCDHIRSSLRKKDTAQRDKELQAWLDSFQETRAYLDQRFELPNRIGSPDRQVVRITTDELQLFERREIARAKMDCWFEIQIRDVLHYTVGPPVEIDAERVVTLVDKFYKRSSHEQRAPAEFKIVLTSLLR